MVRQVQFLIQDILLVEAVVVKTETILMVELELMVE
jgi:hypothetical protein